MLGEMVGRLDFDASGAIGDRVCALIDRATGKVASAKLSRRWRGLLQFASRDLGNAGAQGRPLVEVELPDGIRLRSDLPNIDERLSAAPGREVTLAFSRPAGLAGDGDPGRLTLGTTRPTPRRRGRRTPCDGPPGTPGPS